MSDAGGAISLTFNYLGGRHGGGRSSMAPKCFLATSHRAPAPLDPSAASPMNSLPSVRHPSRGRPHHHMAGLSSWYRGHAGWEPVRPALHRQLRTTGSGGRTRADHAQFDGRWTAWARLLGSASQEAVFRKGR